MNDMNCATMASGQTNSPCQDAANRLSAAQQCEADVIGRLYERLGAVLRSPMPQPDTDAAATAGPESELHAWLLTATDRAQHNVNRIGDILQRLTI